MPQVPACECDHGAGARGGVGGLAGALRRFPCEWVGRLAVGNKVE